MSRVYVFGPNDEENDYSTMGLVGTLFPSKGVYTPVANGDSIVTLTHPVDELRKYVPLLQLGNILVVPVPVRTTPEIQNGTCVTTVWTYNVKPLNQLTAKSQRTLYKKKTGGTSMKLMKAGDALTIVWQTEETGVRWKAKTRYGTGWVDPEGIVLVTQHIIADNSQAIEEIQSPWVITPQYFRIFEKNIVLGEVQVTARQLYYDLLHNTTRYFSAALATLQTASNGVLTNCYNAHPFTVYTNVANTVPGLDYKLRNPIDSFLNPENGLCKKFDVGLVVDNYELYLLHDPGLNRGIKVKYRRNMTGIKFRSNDDTVATRIIPTGETKDGDELMLDTDITKHYVDSVNIAAYPTIRSYHLKCDNCKVGDKDDNDAVITETVARARMRQQALDLLANRCDEPQIELEVEFLKLGDTEEYKQFKDLENVFLFDYVLVQHPDFDIDVTAQIVGITWDFQADRLAGIKIGSVGKTLANTGITTWQVPSGFSGTKIAGGTVGNNALKPDIIAARHVQADSINAGAIQAGAVSTIHLAANSIDATKIKANEITAEKIAANTITADQIAAKTITSDQIAANTITADQIAANTITANKLVAGIITAENGLIEEGAIGTIHIKNASVTDAKIIDLSASKISAGTIDATYIEVINLKAANITVGTINGQQISQGAIDTNHLIDGAIKGDKIDFGAIKANKLNLAQHTIW